MDLNFEFDCPKYYDFSAPTPSTKRKATELSTPASKKRKCSPTLAEAVFKFQHSVPQRFARAASSSQVRKCTLDDTASPECLHFTRCNRLLSQAYQKPSLTRPQPFNLYTSERAEMRPQNSSTGEEEEVFCMQLVWLRFRAFYLTTLLACTQQNCIRIGGWEHS